MWHAIGTPQDRDTRSRSAVMLPDHYDTESRTDSRRICRMLILTSVAGLVMWAGIITVIVVLVHW